MGQVWSSKRKTWGLRLKWDCFEVIWFLTRRCVITSSWNHCRQNGLQFFLVMACSESWIPKLNMLEIFRNSGNCCFCIYNDLLGESIDLIKHIEKNNFRRGNMKGNLIFWPSLYQLFRMIFILFYSLTMISSFCSITM